MEKFAIEFKSPKMQQVLQGAMDKAFALHAHPRGTGGTNGAGIGGGQALVRPKRRAGYEPPAPFNHADVRSKLQQLAKDGDAARLARVERMRKLPFAPLVGAPADPARAANFHPEPSSIGRPKENAATAQFTRLEGSHQNFPRRNPKATRTISPVRAPWQETREPTLEKVLNALPGVRAGVSRGEVSDFLSDKIHSLVNTTRDPATRALRTTSAVAPLQKNAPEIAQQVRERADYYLSDAFAPPDAQPRPGLRRWEPRSEGYFQSDD